MPVTHAATIAEAIATAKPIPGTRYSLGSMMPTVSLSARPRPIYVLTVDGVEVDRGSKADLVTLAKSPATNSYHARCDATLARARGEMDDKVSISMLVTFEVNAAEWARDYGITLEEVRADAREYLKTYIAEPHAEIRGTVN